jgi:hypothetical protein
VAQFEIARDIRAVDLSQGHGKFSFIELTFREMTGEDLPSADKKERSVWIEIDNAFSRPITVADNTADYVPTQILAELFRHSGYDAVIYKSQFGERGYNIALFDVGNAAAINCAPYEVSGIEVKFKEIGNRWFKKR